MKISAAVLAVAIALSATDYKVVADKAKRIRNTDYLDNKAEGREGRPGADAASKEDAEYWNRFLQGSIVTPRPSTAPRPTAPPPTFPSPTAPPPTFPSPTNPPPSVPAPVPTNPPPTNPSPTAPPPTNPAPTAPPPTNPPPTNPPPTNPPPTNPAPTPATEPTISSSFLVRTRRLGTRRHRRQS